jgi:predicted RNA-binding Zn-ribbon protein involved in translation (DUF1610 family)
LGKDLSGIRQAHQQLTDRIHQIEDWRRRPFLPSTVNIYLKVVERFFNVLCPCCGETTILSPKGGRLPTLEVDHFRGCQWSKITDGWPICDRCHKDLTHGYLSRDGWVLQAFRAFQLRVNQYLSRMNGGKQITLF